MGVPLESSSLPPPSPGAPARRRPEAPPEGFPLSPTGAGFEPAGGDEVLVGADVLDGGRDVLVAVGLDCGVVDEDADALEVAVVCPQGLAELEVEGDGEVEGVDSAAKAFSLMKCPSVACVGTGLPALLPRCTFVKPSLSTMNMPRGR